jgi:cytochrome c peroxidase
MPDGVAIDRAGRSAWIDGRNSHDVVALALRPDDAIAPAVVDGAPIERLGSDPMPTQLRLGQRLFHSANSAYQPITQNFWVSCSSCHLEGSTDAVTWLFNEGPRDTPSNAGGPINTGFLLRQGLRNKVQQYDVTIDVEQGGDFHAGLATQAPLLDALAAYVNQAIPLPRSPDLAPDGTLGDGQRRGKTVFDDHCASCHFGPYLTDSGAGNAGLDLAGPILLHDIGTCVTRGAFLDQPALDAAGIKMHTACDFDTPSLRGVFATPPFFHDGSAATLEAVVDRLPYSAALPAAQKADLVAYLKTL